MFLISIVLIIKYTNSKLLYIKFKVRSHMWVCLGHLDTRAYKNTLRMVKSCLKRTNMRIVVDTGTPSSSSNTGSPNSYVYRVSRRVNTGQSDLQPLQLQNSFVSQFNSVKLTPSTNIEMLFRPGVLSLD